MTEANESKECRRLQELHRAEHQGAYREDVPSRYGGGGSD